MKRQEIVLGTIAVIFILIYMLMNRDKSILLNFTNGSFIIGGIYVIIGMRNYIRNVGLFKTFRYFAYKLKSGAYSSKKMGQVHTMSLAEFTEEIRSEENQIPVKAYYLFGIPLVSISYILAFLK